MPYMNDRRGACDGRCNCCPYGCTYVAPVILVVLAMIITWGTTFSCGYYRSSFVDNSLLPEVTIESSFRFGPLTVQQFNVTGGLINKEDSGECVGWSDHDTLDHDDLDTPLVFARAVLLLITIPVFIFFIIFLFASCCVFQPLVLKIMTYLFIFAGVFYPLALVSMASEWCKDANDCSVQGGFITVWFTFALWIAGGVSIMYMKEKDQPPPPPQSSAVEMPNRNTTTLTQVTEKTVVEEDGTVVKITTKKQTAPDGVTQTVTETREVLQHGRKGTAPVAVAASADVYDDEEIPVAAAKPVHY